MVYKQLTFIGLVSIFLLTFSPTLLAQTVQLKSKGVKEKHYVALKTLDFSETDNTSYMFSSQTTYMLKIDNPAKKKYLLTIYDKDKKPIVSNLNPTTKKYYNTVLFNCGLTQLYYITLTEDE